ncbi:MAG: endonuclease/exonuclease/phosphatase family protein [Chloroflexi bacterium]|nr:endonuclease/exonuclease/phosphatase family protein [Chloroflexota bacterium]
MKKKLHTSFRSIFLAASDLIFAFFFLWYALMTFTDGRFILVSLLNMFAFQIFLLLIPFALAGILLRVRRLQAASLAALILFVITFGKFFLPKQKILSSPADTLKVMTYNMLVFTPDVVKVAEVIREENADIVFMQETSFAMADYLQEEMLDEYPYQIHDPSDIPLGMSVVSKYPFQPIDGSLGEGWVGTPILLAVDWNGKTVNAINFHMPPTGLAAVIDLGAARRISKMRASQAANIVRFLEGRSAPAVVAGDANDVFLNDAYRTLVGAGLQDVWSESGFGLGHTFPGNKSVGTSRLHIGGIYIPEWLVRIDYLFVSREWEPLSAHLARTDGYSDHRGVVALLRLR